MHLTLHLTRACNMNCRYCYSPPLEQSPGMSLDIAKQALLLGAKLNPASSCGIIFFGGEPLLQNPSSTKSSTTPTTSPNPTKANSTSKSPPTACSSTTNSSNSPSTAESSSPSATMASNKPTTPTA